MLLLEGREKLNLEILTKEIQPKLRRVTLENIRIVYSA
jgi:hypothetical protein